jgi:hypothetical protein
MLFNSAQQLSAFGVIVRPESDQRMSGWLPLRRMTSSSRTSGAPGRLAVVPASLVCWRSCWLATVRGRCCTSVLYCACRSGSRVGFGARLPTFRFSGRTYLKSPCKVPAFACAADRGHLPLVAAVAVTVAVSGGWEKGCPHRAMARVRFGQARPGFCHHAATYALCVCLEVLA